MEALDKDGNLYPLADHKIEIIVIGNAQLVGVGNGNPQSFEPFQANYVHLFYGKAMLILASDIRKGNTEVTVKSTGLLEDTIKIVIE